ncbi:MAG: hypothetical protein FWD15_04410 [Alphaproteobacteria bacterium]|nr:hypothetical protein [Alphaproteobacteria bacterium]
MGTTNGLTKAFYDLGDIIIPAKKTEKESKQEKREKEIEEQERQLEIDRLLYKRDKFNEEKGNLLREKLASNNARMAAAGLVGTSASMEAFRKYFASKSEREMLANEFFSDLDLKKLELELAKKSELSLLNNGDSGGKKSLLSK